MVFRQIDEEICFYQDLVIQAADIGISMVMSDQPADPVCDFRVRADSVQQPGRPGIGLPRPDGTYRRMGKEKRGVGGDSQMHSLRKDKLQPGSG